MTLENVTLNDRGQSQKTLYYAILIIWKVQNRPRKQASRLLVLYDWGENEELLLTDRDSLGNYINVLELGSAEQV